MEITSFSKVCVYQCYADFKYVNRFTEMYSHIKTSYYLNLSEKLIIYCLCQFSSTHSCGKSVFRELQFSNDLQLNTNR